jgi:hypothetical protein
LTISVWPFSDAISNGVAPSSLFLLISAPLLIALLASSKRPFFAANIKLSPKASFSIAKENNGIEILLIFV